MATPFFTQWSMSQLTVAFGPILLDGYQAGEAVTVEWNQDLYSMEVGVDGKATRSQILDRSAVVTINLAQSSHANDLLSAVYILGASGVDVNGNPVGPSADVAPLLIKDRGGRTLLSAPEAWIARAPDMTFDQPSTVRAWVIHCARLAAFIGGN